MARRTKTITINDEKSRDHDKSYLITEMAAEQAEWWAFRVLQALLGSDASIDFNAPLSEVARQGFMAVGKMEPEKAKPLLEEMMGCVKTLIPNSSSTRDILPGDIEEVQTRIKLRQAIFGLHVDFFTTGTE